MTSTTTGPTTGQTTSRTQTSTRLRRDVDLYATADGHVLRVGALHHHVHLGAPDAAALLDALALDHAPVTHAARSALDTLVEAGLVDVAPPRLDVTGDGALASALAAALVRMGATVGDGGAAVVALDAPRDLPDAGPACWVDDHLVVLAPPAVPPRDVVGRRRAATRHRDDDPRTAAVPGGRAVTAAPSRAGLELAAVVVAAELLRVDRAAHEAVAVDLRALTVTRHPVLPLPPAPR